ncbi:site-specific integrase [Methylotenera sp.]|uniref:site-specific integrase n=1 Tax=Methylotenera sp. TaxID=2051956 RepID=UPI00273659BB|nr:site-specific integrase [Methylotenera sp.]MDP3210400.1 site-specific integrase [Methylotenera sp.]
MYSIEQLIFESGERFPMLLDEDGMPDFWATLYTSNNLRALTQTSITSILRSINHFYKWQQAFGRDLFQEINEGKVPDSNFVISLKEFCGMRDDLIQNRFFSERQKKVINLLDLKLAIISVHNQVGSDYQSRRMSDISLFIDFVGREIVRRKSNAEKLLGALHNLGREFKSNLPKSTYGRNNRALPHAEKKAFDDFMDLFEIDSIRNPFKNEGLKLRNYILIQLLFLTGFRSGEVLSITLDDIGSDTEYPVVSVKRNHDDKNDSRRFQPVAKTIGRGNQITPKLLESIDKYIFKVRGKFEAAKKHPYLLISHKGKSAGQPLSNSTFYNRVILTAKKVNFEEFKLVRRHGFRHYFNERLSDKIDSFNEAIELEMASALEKNEQIKAAHLKSQLITEKKEIEMRMLLNGHTNESSAIIYLERHTKRKAQRVHKEMMQDTSKKINEIKRQKKQKYDQT